MKITFLGTGCMVPTKDRNHSGIFVQYKNENILLDCGEGIQRQMRIAGLKPAKITKLCISHWHGDHVFGIPGLLSTMGADQFSGKLEIYGPKGTKIYLKNLFRSFAAKSIIPYSVMEGPGKLFEDNNFILHAVQLKHSVPCLGFSIIEKDRLRIDVKKTKKFGLSGPVLGKLQLGENITIAGKKIKSSDVTYVVPGKKLSYIADTIPCKGADWLAKDATLLISEGTHLNDIKEKTTKYMHLTVTQAAAIAKKGQVKDLIITHISQRYKDDKEVLKEAKTKFSRVKVANDFMQVEI